MSFDKITISAIVSADKNQVWEYYTSPEHITQWNFADPSWHCPSATNDLRVGGRYATITFVEVDGKTEVTITFDPETQNPIELQRNGWQAILNNFKQYTEAH